MGKGTKKRFKKLQEAYDEYNSAMNYYNGELEQLKSDRAEIEFAKKSGDVAGIPNMLKVYKLRAEHVLGKDRKRKDDAILGVQKAYQELVDYWDKKKPKEKTNPKYQGLKDLIDELKNLALVL